MEQKGKTPGSVLVVGAGIAGIQSSLDLANAGFKVYLLEESPAIGGTMAQLDKTFPTNDCAMCIISPKLVECGRHLNIELLTTSELRGVDGEAGNFRVQVYQHPRYVDLEKCTGCGECEKVCPVETPSIFDEGIVNRKAAYKLYAQASPNAFVLDKRQTAPCQINCPSGIHVQGYIALAKEGRYKEAYDLIREQNPFVSVCGRVCFHPCETHCRRGEYDQPLAIASIKRYIADHIHSHQDEFETPPKPDPDGEKVAVVGAGPAGLTCAFYLARMGYRVRILEREPKAGGMMRWAIPPYRMPRDELDWEISRILDEGIELQTGASVSSFDQLEQMKEDGFKAFFLAVGTQKGLPLRVKGEELNGVLSGIDFLRDLNLGKDVKIGKKVGIIGGGNTAIDCARTARRLGSEVTVLYRRTRKEMPAAPHEITAAMEEGIEFRYLTAPTLCKGEDGVLKSVEFAKMKLGAPDASGRRRPVPTGETYTGDFDNIIAAISQTTDLDFLQDVDVDVTRWQTLKVDPLTFATSMDGVFAGGDVVLGPASVVEAVAHGHEAAISIDRYLRGADLRQGREINRDIVPDEQFDRFVPCHERVKMPETLPAERIRNFQEVETGFSEEQMFEEASRCLQCGVCSSCMQCAYACESEAILHDQMGRELEINVGAILMATGLNKFDPTIMHEFGFGRFSNVVTSIQFERILAASGPYEGHLQRPVDGKVPRKIAWIQCVGSRTEDSHMPWCSSVCCMYAIKEAVIAKEHVSTVEPTIFYMDLRAFGKDFDKFYERAQNAGVNFVRARVGKVKEIRESGNLEVYYTMEDGGNRIEEFEMVVLSVGIQPPSEVSRMADLLGIHLNEYDFTARPGLSPIETTRPGVFVCGPTAQPKDIPETVMEASGAVAGAAEILSAVRGTEITEKEYPPERDVTGHKPRVGVFVCHCGINIGSVVDVPGVVEYAKSLPNVVMAEENLFSCSQDTQQKMKELIQEHRLNRVVVASCSPTTHEALFQETLREAGLNPYLFEMANIRNQCSWVHRDQPQAATQKAKTLVRMAVGKTRLLEPLHTVALPVTQKALVIGGGLAGITAALSIANQGYEVALVEKQTRLGGNLHELRRTADGDDVKAYLFGKINEVLEHPSINVYIGGVINKIEGYIGNYKTTIKAAGIDVPVQYDHGVILIATGAVETKPNEYLYGEHEGVLTQVELEQAIEDDPKSWSKTKNVVMIQCVGSRNDEHPYCSRVCCTQSIKNALRIKELNPKTNVFVLNRDIRTYGFQEKFYQQAREAGVIFVRYETDNPPVTETSGKHISVRVRDHVVGRDIVILADRLVLAAAMVPRDDAQRLSQMLKIPLNEDGFFMEAHVKLRPVDFAAEGIFLAGLAHSPKNISETISQAKAASERATMIISSDEYVSEAVIARVDQDTCAGCGMCVSVCPYDAPELIWRNGVKVAHVNSALCKGCGSCASVCPSGAMQQLGFKEEQTYAVMQEALETW